MILIAPESAPQIYTQPFNGVAHPLAPEVMNAMLRHGSRPVVLWRLITGLSSARQTHGRAQRRCLRLRFWGAVRELLKFRVLFRHGPLIATSNFAIRPRPKSPRRLSPSVGAATSEIGGSNRVAVAVEKEPSTWQAPERKLVAVNQSTPPVVPEPKSATPTPAAISEAAARLARRPRKVGRPWTGYLAGERLKRGALVQVPTGDILPAYVVLRGKVLVALPDEPRYAGRMFDRYDAGQVRRVKLPEAQLLGATKPRPGSRQRGRPRRPPTPLGTTV